MKLFDAIMKHRNIKDAALELEINYKDIHGMLLELGVQHEPRQRYKEAVQDFLDAGNPIQLSLDI
jgi:hypothetical protein|tara:strand:+ start:160 stop:354 length:195 start_codon:yes stop_codon:yes gene_type:complete